MGFSLPSSTIASQKSEKKGLPALEEFYDLTGKSGHKHMVSSSLLLSWSSAISPASGEPEGLPEAGRKYMHQRAGLLGAERVGSSIWDGRPTL